MSIVDIINTEHNVLTAKHWVIRVGDGSCLVEGKYNLLGYTNNKDSKYVIHMCRNMKKGDVIWFVSNKHNDFIIIGVAEFMFLDHISNYKYKKIPPIYKHLSLMVWIHNYRDIEDKKFTFRSRRKQNIIKYIHTNYTGNINLYQEYMSIIKFIKPRFSIFNKYLYNTNSNFTKFL